MKFDKFVLAVMVVGILITGSVVAVVVYNTVQNSRIVHISVKTDQIAYDSGENVTFKLFDNTPGIDFNITDQTNSPQNFVNGDFGEIRIVKIPDDLTSDRALDDLSIENLFNKQISTDVFVATVHFNYFSSKQSPLTLSWDGNIAVYNEFTDGISSFPANSGNYVILPDFVYASGHKIQFSIDRGAIFHYEGLDAGINMTNNPNNNVTVKLTLGAPPGTTGNLTCQLYSDLQYDEFPVGTMNDTVVFPSNNHYHNETLVIAPRDDIMRTILFEARVPDHGNPAGDGHSFQTVRFDAWLVTPVGNFTFGFNGIWDGGWKLVQQY